MKSLSANELPGPYPNWQDDLPEVRQETREEQSDNYWAGRAVGHALRAVLGDAPEFIVRDVEGRLSQIEANATRPKSMGAQLCVPDLALLPPNIARGMKDGFTDPSPERSVVDGALLASRHQK